MFVSQNGHKTILKTLVEKGADMNKQDQVNYSLFANFSAVHNMN